MGMIRNAGWSWVAAAPTRWLLALAGVGAWIAMYLVLRAAGTASDQWSATELAGRCPGGHPGSTAIGRYWVMLGLGVLAVLCFFAATMLFAGATPRLARVKTAIGLSFVIVGVLVLPLGALLMVTDPAVLHGGSC